MAATVIAYRRDWTGRSLDLLIMLPLGTSAVTIGLGFIVALDQPIDLRTSPWLIPLAHSLVAIPFVVRTALPVLRSVKNRLREAAAVLGAPPGRVWREIDLPLVARRPLWERGSPSRYPWGNSGPPLSSPARTRPPCPSPSTGCSAVPARST